MTKAKTPALPKVEIPATLEVPDSWAESLGTDDPDVRYALSAQKRVSEGVHGLVSMRRHRDPKTPAAAHLADLEGHSQRVKKSAEQAVSTARGRLAERIVKAESAIHERIAKETQHSAEIRRAFREMPAQERAEALRAAIDSGDRHVAGAVLGAPGITSGLDNETLGKLRSYAARTLEPQLMAEREHLERADSLLDQVGRDAMTVAEAAAPTSEQRRAYESEQAAHDEALLAMQRLDAEE